MRENFTRLRAKGCILCNPCCVLLTVSVAGCNKTVVEINRRDKTFNRRINIYSPVFLYPKENLNILFFFINNFSFYYIRDIFSMSFPFDCTIIREPVNYPRSHVYKIAAFYLSRIPESYFRS